MRMFFLMLALICGHMSSIVSVTMDFESLKVTADGTFNVSNFYVEDGFRVDTAGQPFKRYGTGSTEFQGSTALFNSNTSGSALTTLTRNGGGLFSLFSMDLAELLLNTIGSAVIPVNFVGTKFDDSIVKLSLSNLDNLPGFQKIDFTAKDFTSLKSVVWKQEARYHQFDNLVLEFVNPEDPGTVPVPEPETYLLLGLSLFWLGHKRKGLQSLARSKRV